MSYTITPNDYFTNNVQAAIADQIMAKAGVDRNDVALIVVDDTTATLTVYTQRDRNGVATAEITVVYP